MFHHLYMDNFCDPRLFLELEGKQVLGWSTVRANRKGFPQNIVLTCATERRMDCGDYIRRCHGNLVAMDWYDHVLCIWSPQSMLDEPTTVQHHSIGGAQQPIPCPSAQYDYQGIFGQSWVGWLNSTELFHDMEIKESLEKFFYHGLEVCLPNTSTTLKKVKQTPQGFLSFRIAIVHHLLEDKCFHVWPDHPPSRPPTEMDARRLKQVVPSNICWRGQERLSHLYRGSFC